MISDFPGEPIGGEDAIIWHLERIEFHEVQASMAEATGYLNVEQYHDDLRSQHQSRLKVLEDRFPETAKTARAFIRNRDPSVLAAKALAQSVRAVMQLSRAQLDAHFNLAKTPESLPSEDDGSRDAG